jgi:uncharacterized protein YecE (DUF72 family)
MAELENTNTGAEAQAAEPATPKTYTEEEVQALLQKEGDRRVTEALKKAERKQLDKEREATKLARMNEQEKYEYKLTQKEQELQEWESRLRLAENKNEASKILAEKDIDLALVDFVVAEDAEKMNENIKKIDKAIKASVAKRLAGKSPVRAPEPSEGLTKDAFRKMSLAEQNRLFVSDPELYRKLTQ